MNYDFSKHKFRAHMIGDLMTGITSTQLTPKQKDKLDEYELRNSGEGKPLTDNQKSELAKLIEKRDAPPKLSDTVTSKLQEIFFEYEYGKKKEVSTKYMDKGLEVESESVTLLSEVDGRPYFKNKERKENDLITGLPDIDDKVNKKIIDNKASWSTSTFPLFKEVLPTKLYWWQAQGYMWLWGYDRAEIVYTLINTPEHLIFDEIRREQWKQNLIDVTDEFEDEIRNNLTFGNIPTNHRIKRFEVLRDENAINQMKTRLVECRRYLMAVQKLKE